MRDGVLAQRLALRVHPQHQRPPAAGARQPGQNADERGFARAVRPQQAQNAAFGHVKRHLIQRHKGGRAAAQGRVTLADGLKGEGGGHGARDCRSSRPPAREQEIRAASRSARGRKSPSRSGPEQALRAGFRPSLRKITHSARTVRALHVTPHQKLQKESACGLSGGRALPP